MKKSLIILLIINLIPLNQTFSQNQYNKESNLEINTLKIQLISSKEDTSKINLLLKIAEQFINIHRDTAIVWAEKAYELSQKINDIKHKYSTSNWLSRQYRKKGINDKSLEYGLKSLKYAEESNNKILIINANRSLSRFYSDRLRNLTKGLFYGKAALQLSNELGDLKEVIVNLESVSTIYFNHGQFDEALTYSGEEYKIALQLNDQELIAWALASLGDCHRMKENYPLAINYYRQAIDIGKKDSVKCELGTLYNNLAVVYGQTDNEKEKAIYYYLLAVNFAKKYNSGIELNYYYDAISQTYFDLKDFENALKYNQLVLEYDQSRGALHEMQHIYLNNAKINIELKEYKKACESFDKYISLRNEFENKESQNKISEMEVALESEKKQKQIDLINKDNELQKTIRNSFIGGFGLVLILAGVSYRNFLRKRNDNFIITEQKKKVEFQMKLVKEKNREITDSIEYALRIQTAILPPTKIVKQYLENSFIVYKPKDIVAGDFYWMETYNDLVLFAACDCTGHGVPGAMVSVVCHNALNRAVKEFGLIVPASILDKTAEIVIENFSKSEEEIKDGMDISLCAYNTKTKILQWSGANNPLWLMQNGVLIETKADKQPIGMNEDGKPFTNHTFILNDGDTIYLFTDGFADQFGGATGEKKLTKRRFKELIVSVQSKSIIDQGIALDRFITEYRKEIEQIDDILVMGVKV
jgi:serine phosphatase RsbU (regulator of sigma subunit)